MHRFYLYTIGLLLSIDSCIVLGELRRKDNRDYHFRNFLEEISDEIIIDLSFPGPNPDPVPPPNPVPPMASPIIVPTVTPPNPVPPVSQPITVPTVTPPTPSSPVAPPVVVPTVTPPTSEAPVVPPTPASPVAPPPVTAPTVTPPTPASPVVAPTVTPPTPVGPPFPEVDCPCPYPYSDPGCCYLPLWACVPGDKQCLANLPIAPVCGCDGKTYLHLCIALVENCLRCWTDGPCLGPPVLMDPLPQVSP